MNIETFEHMLRLWGRSFGERQVIEDDNATGPAVHPLARAMQFAPGRRSTITLASFERAGQARRRIMGAAAGMACVPAGFVDTIPCIESRASYGSGSQAWPEVPEVQRIERAALELITFDRLRGLCLRVAYCTRGMDEDKAQLVSERYGEPVKKKRFRDERNMAKVWIHGRVSNSA